MIDFILWYITISVIGWITFPLAYRFFSFLPDRGYALSRVFGLLLWGYGFWLLGSLHILQNNTAGVVLAFFVLFGICMITMRGGKKDELISWIRKNKTTILMSEGVFLVAFSFLTLVRASNPDIIGTEKPMELAFINAILRSPGFPPNDPWLSGYSISYYYFGYVMIAMIIHITGTSSPVAFNLAIALVFALAAVNAYGLVFNLVDIFLSKKDETKRKLEPKDEKLASPALTTLFWSLLGPLYILIVSNIEGFLEMLHARGVFWHLTSNGTYESNFWKWLNIQEIVQPPTQPFSWEPNRAGGSWWWRASRVLQDFDLAGNSKEIIDEFPFFSFLLADLHAHVIAIPFVLLAIAVSLNYWTKGKPGKSDSILVIDIRTIDFWLAAIVFGSLAFLNIWDFPIYVVLFACVVTLIQVRNYGISIYRIVEFIETGLLFGIAGVCLYLPFFLGFSSQAGGILPSMIYMTRGVHFWVMFMPMLVPILVWLFWSISGKREKLSLKNGIFLSVLIVFGLLTVSLAMGFMVMKMAQSGEGYASIMGGYGIAPVEILQEAIRRRLSQPGTLFTLLVMLIPVAAILLAQPEIVLKKEKIALRDHEVTQEDFTINNKANIFIVLLVLLGIGLVLFPETFYLRDQFGWRMNTIFKFYYQAWILWGISAATATVILFHRLKKVPGILFSTGWILIFLMSLAYPFFGVVTKTNGFDPSELSLDGSSYIARSSSDEMEAIHWLEDAPSGVIAEAVGGSYTNFARISTYTGLPTVIGWPGHESQWRGGSEEMGSREQDIQKLYVSSSWKETKELIDQYHIRYIYIGSREKSTYRVNETKFENNLRSVFTSNDVVIYEVPDWAQ